MDDSLVWTSEQLCRIDVQQVSSGSGSGSQQRRSGTDDSDSAVAHPDTHHRCHYTARHIIRIECAARIMTSSSIGLNSLDSPAAVTTTDE
jgi:hypothetical protein